PESDLCLSCDVHLLAFCLRQVRPMLGHEVSLEKDLSVRLDLEELPAYFLFADGPHNPALIQALETFPVKPALRLVQEFKILRYRHEVLAFFKALAHSEITQHFR